MNHKEFESLIEKYSLGTIPERKKRAFEAHMLVCKKCRNKLLVLERILSTLSEKSVRGFLAEHGVNFDKLLENKIKQEQTLEKSEVVSKDEEKQETKLLTIKNSAWLFNLIDHYAEITIEQHILDVFKKCKIEIPNIPEEISQSEEMLEEGFHEKMEFFRKILKQRWSMSKAVEKKFLKSDKVLIRKFKREKKNWRSRSERYGVVFRKRRSKLYNKQEAILREKLKQEEEHLKKRVQKNITDIQEIFSLVTDKGTMKKVHRKFTEK